MTSTLPILLIALLSFAPAGRPPEERVGGKAPDPRFEGLWQLDAERSTAVDPWRSLSVEIRFDGNAVVLKRIWRGSREGGAFIDSAYVIPGGAPATVRLGQWPDNRHLGAYITGDSTKTVTAKWEDGASTLVTDARLAVEVQQGTVPVRIYTEYRLSPDGR